MTMRRTIYALCLVFLYSSTSCASDKSSEITPEKDSFPVLITRCIGERPKTYADQSLEIYEVICNHKYRQLSDAFQKQLNTYELPHLSAIPSEVFMHIIGQDRQLAAKVSQLSKKLFVTVCPFLIKNHWEREKNLFQQLLIPKGFRSNVSPSGHYQIDIFNYSQLQGLFSLMNIAPRHYPQPTDKEKLWCSLLQVLNEEFLRSFFSKRETQILFYQQKSSIGLLKDRGLFQGHDSPQQLKNFDFGSHPSVLREVIEHFFSRHTDVEENFQDPLPYENFLILDEDQLVYPEHLTLKNVKKIAAPVFQSALLCKHLDCTGLTSLILGSDGPHQELLFSKAFDRIKNLTHLDLSGLNLKTIPPFVWQNKRLFRLDLSDNQLEEMKAIQPSQQLSLPRLRHLNLAKNQLHSIPNFVFQHTRLRTLSLSTNNFEVVPKEIKKFQNLRLLDFQYNKIKEIHSDLFEIETLYYLNVADNLYESLPCFQISCWADKRNSDGRLRTFHFRSPFLKTLDKILLFTSGSAPE